MTTPQLVRHPPPRATESLPGYVLRLNEANGYASAKRLFQLAGMGRSEAAWSSFNLAKLAAISGCTVKSIGRIAFKQVGDESQTFRLLSHPVLLRDLSLSHARVCPECVAELGYIEAHWHLDLMVGCPVHARPGIWFCGNCSKRITWHRSGLLTCICGADLKRAPVHTLSAPEVALLALIRHKALGRLAPPAPSTMPSDALLRLDLMSLLSLVRSCGYHRLMATRPQRELRTKDVLRAAATVLEDWPHAYNRLLSDIHSGSAPIDRDREPDDLSHVYKELFTAREARFGKRLASPRANSVRLA